MQNLSETMNLYALGAVKVAANTYHVRLDFSEESIKKTEAIFKSLYREAHRTFLVNLFRRGLTETQISSAALMLGAYIGEVIRRIHGGEWISEDLPDSKEVITLKINDSYLDPVEKAYQRIKNGSEDDLWFFYQAFVTKIKAQESK